MSIRAGEFELIQQLVNSQSVRRDEVVLGIGDDAAVLDIPDGYELVVSTDTLNIGVHFPQDTSPEDIGYKSLAVGLSDLAAMGAEPVAANLSLSLPVSDSEWLKAFTSGFYELANRFNVQLMGGDTTQGSLSISVTVFGKVPKGQAIKRCGANAGDLVYVTGTLGDAGAALLALQGELKITGPQKTDLLKKLNRPTPRVEAGLALSGLATACIDISDGLTADLGHILEQSQQGATLYVDQIPISETLRECFDRAGGWALPLGAGDDYELCFTIAGSRQAELEKTALSQDVAIRYIGVIEPGKSLTLSMPDGSLQTTIPDGYEHFSTGS